MKTLKKQNEQYLSDLVAWGARSENANKYPDLIPALEDFSKIIGSEAAKQHVFKRIKALILLYCIQCKSGHEGRSKRQLKRKSTLPFEEGEPKQKKTARRSNGGRYNLREQSMLSDLHHFHQFFGDAIGYRPDTSCCKNSDGEEDGSPEQVFFTSTGPGEYVPVQKNRCGENLHTVFLGPPGSGKTFMAEKLYNLYASLGFVQKNKFRVVTRGDLVGKYLGWTANITKKLIAKYKNGVIFVDEAYSLVNSPNDSYGKEALTELMESMTNMSKNITIFFAGYKKETLKHLFESNAGLERRIDMVLETTKSTSVELRDIFLQELESEPTLHIDLPADDTKLVQLFETHADVLSNNGGDIKVLLGFIKMETMERYWHKVAAPSIGDQDDQGSEPLKFAVTLADMKGGFRAMKAMRKSANLTVGGLEADTMMSMYS